MRVTSERDLDELALVDRRTLVVHKSSLAILPVFHGERPTRDRLALGLRAYWDAVSRWAK
jgi:hypothetical protein